RSYEQGVAKGNIDQTKFRKIVVRCGYAIGLQESIIQWVGVINLKIYAFKHVSKCFNFWGAKGKPEFRFIRFYSSPYKGIWSQCDIGVKDLYNLIIYVKIKFKILVGCNGIGPVISINTS